MAPAAAGQVHNAIGRAPKIVCMQISLFGRHLPGGVEHYGLHLRTVRNIDEPRHPPNSHFPARDTALQVIDILSFSG
jgi:hypothetical protein